MGTARDIILKVAFGRDIRRLRFKWDPSADCEESFSQLHTIACIGFNLESNAQLSFRYRDEDGDLCTLVAETFHDCFSFCRDDVLNLVAEQAAFPSVAKAPSSTANLASCAISIASQPSTPRNDALGGSSIASIDEEYEAAWSVVEVSTDSAK